MIYRRLDQSFPAATKRIHPQNFLSIAYQQRGLGIAGTTKSTRHNRNTNGNRSLSGKSLLAAAAGFEIRAAWFPLPGGPPLLALNQKRPEPSLAAQGCDPDNQMDLDRQELAR
jgi:hypothetical protein